MSRGQIHKILTNPVYRGLIRHKDTCHAGLHPAIIDAETWEKVQAHLQAASAKQRGAPVGATLTGVAPLKGKFRDETGDLLTPSHTQRPGRRLRYYISNRLVSGGPDRTAWRLPAPAFEALVAGAIADHLDSFARRHQVLGVVDATRATTSQAAVADLSTGLRAEVKMAAALIAGGTIAGGQISIDLDLAALAAMVGLPAGELNPAMAQVVAPFSCRRRGVEMKLVAGDRKPEADPALVRGLRNAHRWGAGLKAGMPLAALAARERVSERYMARVIPLASLSPRIQSALLKGTQPINLTLESLLNQRLPLDWSDQERLLGFGR